MSKVRLAPEAVKDSVKSMLRYSTEKKKRKFVETVEIHFGLKNFDPARDRRINGSTQLPHVPRRQFKVLILANEKHIDDAKAIGIDFKSLEDLKKINRDKKVVKKLGKSYDVLLASAPIIRQVPRLLGPTLNKIGKFPQVVRPTEELGPKVDQLNKTIKFSLKFKAGGPQCLSAPVGHVEQTPEELVENITASVNYVLTLMKKGWQNIKKIHIKTTMGPTYTIYGF
jgi:large subunit ribosomal protein L10Ae